MNWITTEAKKTIPDKDIVTLVNPETIKLLDDILLNRYHPYIEKQLKETDFQFSIFDELETNQKSGKLTRELGFMIFDAMEYSFFRGTISRSINGYFLEKEFFLELPEETSPEILFRILSEKRFAGMPPEMTMQPSEIRPEWNGYFYITFSNGKGLSQTGYSGYNLDQMAFGEIKDAIHDSIEMHENSMIEGINNIDELEKFLNICYRSYEAY